MEAAGVTERFLREAATDTQSAEVAREVVSRLHASHAPRGQTKPLQTKTLAGVSVHRNVARLASDSTTHQRHSMTGGSIYLLREDDEPIELLAASYDTEKVLQDLIV